uniref:Normal mucosa of esophagus-specific gene 1 protein n=1 Tax=Gopherus evgoodei TaxID=1825980 RepID=A0A8C4YMN1_9SAUR
MQLTPRLSTISTLLQATQPTPRFCAAPVHARPLSPTPYAANPTRSLAPSAPHAPNPAPYFCTPRRQPFLNRTPRSAPLRLPPARAHTSLQRSGARVPAYSRRGSRCLMLPVFAGTGDRKEKLCISLYELCTGLRDLGHRQSLGCEQGAIKSWTPPQAKALSAVQLLPSPPGQLIPLIGFVGFAGVGALAASLYSLCTKSDVIINKSGNPEPWENVNPNQAQKLLSIRQEWKSIEELEKVKKMMK